MTDSLPQPPEDEALPEPAEAEDEEEEEGMGDIILVIGLAFVLFLILSYFKLIPGIDLGF